MKQEGMMTWIPITEKYPEGEEPVFVVVDFGKGRRRVLRAMWAPKNTVDGSMDDYDGDLDYSEEKDCYYWPEGWYEWNEFDEMRWHVGGTVTHWMPLPELPIPMEARN